MHADDIREMAERYLLAVKANSHQTDQVQALGRRLREALHGNHRVLVMCQTGQALFISDRAIKVLDAVILDSVNPPTSLGTTMEKP